MGIKRLFENLEIPVRIVGAGTLDAALSQIRKNPNYSALIIDWDEAGVKGVELACAVKEETELPVVVFQSNWTRDDLCRALQLGVDILFPDSFSPHDLFTELQTLKETGQSPSRARILSKAGEDLLQPDPELWTNQAENWRDRMMGLADQLIRPWSEETVNRASHLESTVIRGSEFDQVPNHFARAMLEVVECGRDRIPEISNQYRIPSLELSKMLTSMEDFCRKHGGLSKLPLLIDEMIKKNRDLDGQSPPQLSLLHRVSRVVIRAQGKPSHRQDALNETIRKFLGVPLGILQELPTEHRFKLALGLLNLESFEQAVDRIGYFVMGLILKRLRREQASQLDIVALNSLLGFDARYTSIQIKSLVRNLAVLNPIPSLHFVELSDIRLALPLLEQMELENGAALHSAIEQLSDMGRTMGPIDQKRLRDLLNAVKYELPVLLARPSWISLYRLLTSDVSPELESLRSRFIFIVGARKSVARERLVVALRHLIEVGRYVMDAARFAELCRNSTMGRLDASIIEDYVDDINEEFTIPPSNRAGAAEERAVLEQAISGFQGFNIDLDGVKDNLPPHLIEMPELSPLEEARLRVMAAGINLAEEDRHFPMLKHFLRGHSLHPEELDALVTLVGELESLLEMREKFVDPTGRFREGYDEVLEDASMVDLHVDDVDFGEPEDWDEDILSVANDVIKGASFEISQSQPELPTVDEMSKQQPRMKTLSQPIDLGLGELEMELDLEGGSLDEARTLQRDISEAEDSVNTGMMSTRDEWNPPIELQGRPLRSTGSYPKVETDILTQRTMVSKPQEVDDKAFSKDPFAVLSDLSKAPKDQSGSATVNDEISILKIKRMLKSGELSAVAKYLAGYPDNSDHLIEALNLTALQAYMGKHFRAAELLWQRAYSIDSDSLNVQFNYARLLHKMGQIDKATPILERFLARRPHFSPALRLMVTAEAPG
jgi:CheY-like chemotaxis protein/tetratricopeptide (TPR) repeat protein